MLHSALKHVSSLMADNALSILIYHQVLEQPDPFRAGDPDAKTFDWHMRLISRYFTPLSLPEALSLQQQGSLPANAVCVTFDDGYVNNLTVAEPILAKYNVPATVFVATAFSAGNNMWNDRILDLFSQTQHKAKLDLRDVNLGLVTPDSTEQRRHLAGKVLMTLKYQPVEQRLENVQKLIDANGGITEEPRMMSPEQIVTLRKKGVNIGAHTHNHPILKGMANEDVRDEINTSQSLLEKWLGEPVRHFAYPNGKHGKDWDDATAEVVAELDFDCAVTTDWGVNQASTDRYRMKRFTPWDNQPWKYHTRMVMNHVGRM